MTTITTMLPEFPLISQLTEPTVDGYPSESARWNCVPESLDAAGRYKTRRAFNADEMKDAVYQQGYVGPQAAAKYVPYMASRGIALSSFKGTPAALVATIHTYLAADCPVVGTIPTKWNLTVAEAKAYAAAHGESYTTHVVVFYGWGTSPGALRAMNPWGGFAHDGDDGYWQDRLDMGEVWIVKASGGSMGVPTNWKDDGTTLTSPNGVTARGGERNFILTHPWTSDDWLLTPAVEATVPDPIAPASGAGYAQMTRGHLLVSIRPVAPATAWKVYTRTAGEVALALAHQLAAVHGATPKQVASAAAVDAVKAALAL